MFAAPHSFAPRATEALVFLDETGDPNYLRPRKLEDYRRTARADYPILFGVAGVLFSRKEYFERFDPAFRRLKIAHFGADIPMHEYDLRKKNAPFDVLRDPTRWQRFHDELAEVCAEHQFTIIVVGIHKPEMQLQYQLHAIPFPTYHYALENIIERTAMQSKNFGYTWRVVAESRERGQNEDLQREMLRLQWEGCGRGIDRPRSNVTAEEVRRKFDPTLVFLAKHENHSGLQIADLAVGPIVRHAYGRDMGERQTFRDIVVSKLCAQRDGNVRGFGLKCYPEFPPGCPL